MSFNPQKPASGGQGDAKMSIKWTLNLLSVVSLFAVMFFSSTAWAHEGRGYGGNYSGRQVQCAPQRGGYVEKRVVEYRRPVVQRNYRREYVNQYQNASTSVEKGNNGNHYGWFQNQSNTHANLTAEQQAKAKEFFEKQKTDRKSFLDSLKS